MAINFDNALGIHADALRVRRQCADKRLAKFCLKKPLPVLCQ